MLDDDRLFKAFKAVYTALDDLRMEVRRVNAENFMLKCGQRTPESGTTDAPTPMCASENFDSFDDACGPAD